MQTQIVTMTPQWAAELLKKNTHNRPLNEKHVRRLMKEMSGGRWKLNGDTISLNGDRLINGQHRLEACVRTGIPFPVILVTGVDSTVFDTIDCGKTRKAADVVALMGERNCTKLAAALQFVRRYETRKVDDCVRYSNSEMSGLLAEHPGVRDSVSKCNSYKITNLVPFSVLAGCHYLFAQKDAALADQVIEQVCVGANLDAKHPMFVFRDRMLRNRSADAKLRGPFIAALFIKAWNRLREGRTMSNLNHPKGAEFPTIQ